MCSNKGKEDFLSLVRLGIGLRTCVFPDDINWKGIEDLALDQGLSAIVLDGIEVLPEDKRPSKALLLNWIGSVLHEYEYRYNAYSNTISELGAFYNSHGIKMMLLKGYACALNWPKPEHRPCGDIDIWLFGKQREADDYIAKDKQVEIDNSHHIHSVFEWNGFTVENHYDFINTHSHKSSKELEKQFKKMGMDDSHTIEINGEKVYVPSPNMNALFLLRHAMAHFAAQGINLRQLLDWAFFAQKHTEEIDWKWLEDELKHYGMMPLYSIFNTICVEDLGFEASIFHGVQFDSILKDRVLNEILSPEYGADLPKGFFHRIIFKLFRWYGSSWKHKLCYKESMLSAFWSGVWGHLLKPSSI